MYRCRHFSIKELVPPEIYESRGQRAWELLDTRILKAIDLIRDDFGPLIVNNWATGGKLKYRGFRPRDVTVGARLSQHRFGRAIDFHATVSPHGDIYEAILTEKYWMVSTVENLTDTPTWIHVDCRNNLTEGIRVVNA